jgi:hypothetical protein
MRFPRPRGALPPGPVPGQSPEACCGGPGRDLRRSWVPALPNLSRLSRAPLHGLFPAPGDARHRGRGRGGGGFGGGGGRGCMCKRQVNARRQPLDSKRPGSCPTAGGASFAQPRSPRPRPPPAGKPPQRATAPSEHSSQSHPMTFRRLPWDPCNPHRQRPAPDPAGEKRPPGAGRALAGGFGPPAGQGSAWRFGRGDGPCQDAQVARRQKSFPLFGQAAHASGTIQHPASH